MKEETARSRSIQDFLRAKRIPCARVHCGKVKVRGGWMQLAESGYPDLWTPLTWLETKTPVGELEDSQIERHDELRRWGERIEVVTSADEARQIIGSLLRQKEHERKMGWL